MSRRGAWRDALDVDLTGVFHTIEVAVPSMIEGKRGGAIVITSSTAGLSGTGVVSRGGLGYVAAKHAVVGLVRAYANNLGEYSIRVHIIHPTGVNMTMIVNDSVPKVMAAHPNVAGWTNGLPVQTLEPEVISDTVARLVSDEGRFITGSTIPVDAGFLNRK